jgi:hypothetical protein
VTDVFTTKTRLALFAKCTAAAAFLLLVLLPGPARGQTATYIWPGLDDYHPDDLVEIFGEGFTPGEAVDIVFHEDLPVPFHSDITLTSVADPAGDIFNNQYLLEEHDAGVTFIVTATGQSSGFSAQTMFLDSAIGDCFRTVASGNWNALATWESATSPCTTWTPATFSPTATTAGAITIRSGHSVTVTAAESADQTTVDAGGTLIVNSGQTLSIANGLGIDLTVNGDIQISGTVTLAPSVDFNVNGTGTIFSGGLLNGNGGSTSTRPFLTVNGAFTVDPGGAITTGGGGPMSHFVNATGVMNVNGPVTGTLQFTINAGGQVNSTANITMGVPPVGAPSSLSISGTLSASGTANVSAQRGDGNPVGAVNFGGLFSLADTATLSIGSVATATFGVANGGTLVLGPTAFANGVGALSVGGGANLKIGSPDGINTSTSTGNVRTAGLDGYQIGANYTYNGSTQDTGNALPTTVNNLTIASSAVVTLSTVPAIQAITNTLTINSGATLREVGNFTLNIGTGGVSNSGTLQLHGGADACPEADTLLIRSTSPGTQRAWSGSGSFDIQDVNVRDQGGTAAIVAVSSTPLAPPPSANNGANWAIISACTADVDECSLNTDNCDANATCTNTAGSFTCTCNSGYTGNGVTCTDIDECASNTHNCDANATCTNIAGSFTCACNAGYSGNGVTCTDVDECTSNTDNCDTNATCTNTAGSFVCGCNPGYSGNGVTCTPNDGLPCDDGNACTQTDTYQGGVCTGSNPVVCTASDQCHNAGTCDPSSGVCSNPAKTNGSSCSDGNACTQTDTCQAGVCSGSNPVVCAASDQCHDAGTCDLSSGVCSTPAKANGSSCSDGNACTLNDTCQAGSCTPGGPDPICAGCGPGNTPPVVTGSTSSNPMPIGGSTNASATASFTDSSGQTHTCSINWDDSSMGPGTVNETNGSGTCTGNHTYAPPSGPVVYTVTVTITDNCGAAGSGVTYVVFYDPNGGFVTGSGWINSPANACTYNAACTGLTGNANFGFVSKYKKASTIPEGDTQFHFSAGDFRFDSDAYEWLVISGAKARYRGTGSVNGTTGFGFELTGWDGQVSGGGGLEKFRIKIWQGSPGNVVYDNERGSPDGSDPVTALGGGSVVIHKK